MTNQEIVNQAADQFGQAIEKLGSALHPQSPREVANFVTGVIVTLFVKLEKGYDLAGMREHYDAILALVRVTATLSQSERDSIAAAVAERAINTARGGDA